MLEIGREVELRDLPRLLSPGLGIVVKKVGGNGSVELLSEPLRECWDLQCRAVEARILWDEEAEIILGAGFLACNRRTCPYQESCTGML